MESKEKEEKVVKPPSNPIPKIKYIGLLEKLSVFIKYPANRPNPIHPKIFTVKVAYGKVPF